MFRPDEYAFCMTTFRSRLFGVGVIGVEVVAWLGRGVRGIGGVEHREDVERLDRLGVEHRELVGGGGVDGKSIFVELEFTLRFTSGLEYCELLLKLVLQISLFSLSSVLRLPIMLRDSSLYFEMSSSRLSTVSISSYAFTLRFLLNRLASASNETNDFRLFSKLAVRKTSQCAANRFKNKDTATNANQSADDR